MVMTAPRAKITKSTSRPQAKEITYDYPQGAVLGNGQVLQRVVMVKAKHEPRYRGRFSLRSFFTAWGLEESEATTWVAAICADLSHEATAMVVRELEKTFTPLEKATKVSKRQIQLVELVAKNLHPGSELADWPLALPGVCIQSLSRSLRQGKERGLLYGSRPQAGIRAQHTMVGITDLGWWKLLKSKLTQGTPM